MEVTSSTENIPSPPGLVKAFKQGQSKVATTLDELDHTFPCRLGIHEHFSPYKVYNLGFGPLFLVKNFVIPFDPNEPQCDASKEVPYLNLFTKLLSKPFSEQSLFPMEGLVICGSQPTQFMNNKSGPSSCSPCLNTIP